MDDLESLIVLLAGASPAALEDMENVVEAYAAFDPDSEESGEEFLEDLRMKLDDHARSVRAIAPKVAGQIFASNLETSDDVRAVLALLNNDASAIYKPTRDRARSLLVSLLGSYSAAEHHKLKSLMGPSAALRRDQESNPS